MRARARAILQFRWGTDATRQQLDTWSRYRGDTFTICSCSMCGNPRRWGKYNLSAWFRLTPQERKASITYAEQTSDMDIDRQNTSPPATNSALYSPKAHPLTERIHSS